MNEVKFRGLDRYGKWHHGGYHKSWMYDENKQPETTYYIVDRYCNGILVEHIDQYTGLKDKNGRDIYEGDIVQQNYRDVYNQCEAFVGEVVYSDCVYWLKNGDEYTFLYDEYRIYNSVVIGNIYENPELLEGDSNV